MRLKARRLLDGPIVHPGLGARLGPNINGPSLIRVPDWLDDPAARYYLYFADHKGDRIRLALADDVRGPWRLHDGAVLHLADTPFAQVAPVAPAGSDIVALSVPRAPGVPSPLEDCTLPHIASPEAVIDGDSRTIRLYHHGLESFGIQVTRVAVSRDGLRFESRDEILARPYLRVFFYRGLWYGCAMPGVFYRSETGVSGFEHGPTLFPPEMRHCALWRKNELLRVLWTRVGDCPERILMTEIELGPDWTKWRAGPSMDILHPERSWEGADCPLEPSLRSSIDRRVNQLRDPAVCVDDERVYLVYAVAGESGLGIAELVER